MNRYVEVPRDRMEAMLNGAGFSRRCIGNELAYVRLHARDARLQVKVLTSIAMEMPEAREVGEDAIRVFAIFTWRHFSDGKERTKKIFSKRIYRVNSVEGVLDRTINAAREAYAACNEFLKKKEPSRPPAWLVPIGRNHP